MQEMGNPPNPGLIVDLGFVVEWQLADDPAVIDLSRAEDELLLPDDARIRSNSAR